MYEIHSLADWHTGQSSTSLLALAFLVQLSLPALVFVLPIALLLLTEPISKLASPHQLKIHLGAVLTKLGEFGVYTVILTLLSTLVCGNWAWVEQTWGST